MNDSLSELRRNIILAAKWWTKPNGYKVTPSELQMIFREAGCEQVPTDEEANKAILNLVNGVKVSGSVKHWCGIFGAYIFATSGVGVTWSLVKGAPTGPGVHFIPGARMAEPGDMGVIKAGNHHFIITDIDRTAGVVRSVDGNTTGQKIRQMERPLSLLVGAWKVVEG